MQNRSGFATSVLCALLLCVLFFRAVWSHLSPRFPLYLLFLDANRKLSEDSMEKAALYKLAKRFFRNIQDLHVYALCNIYPGVI